MRFSTPTMVVFEGLDGSGKSTCAARLAERTGAVLLTTPSPPVRQYRDDLIECLGPSQESRQLFYLATVFSASESARALRSEGRSVVIDRYFLSTQSYAAFRGSRLALDEVGSLLLPADVTIYLDTSLATRSARIGQRGASAADNETLCERADAQLRNEHVRRSGLSVVGRFVCIDGDSDSAERVFDAAVERLLGDGVLLP